MTGQLPRRDPMASVEMGMPVVDSRVDARGLFANDLYVDAARIDRVRAGTVHLAAPRAEFSQER